MPVTSKRIEPEKKKALEKIYESRGTTISSAVRDFLDSELESSADPSDRLNSIFAEADVKLEEYAAPEPTVDDLVSYVEHIRSERAADSIMR